MNKTELISSVAKTAGVSKKDTEQVLNAFFSTVQETLKQNDKVQLPGFGTFEVRERAARTGRNPHTGETIEIAAAKVPAFKPGKGLKDAIQ
ncbi:transcriptional regulator [Butyricicoccus faecihominis]|uniref:Transcriptional regulator n=1 Tax=Butyricicoccus faecihominis TaxID=1712515 RepID=A0ABQ1E1F8_9FIRM|nr:transcriptional regulator [Butyricicoccus faecihominis]GGM66061.1 transcriptional regulator [Butyricicoccus faecihominis]